jgi:hypothetical protein
VVYNGMHDSSLAYNSVQQSVGAFSQGRPPDRGHEHTIDLRLPRIGEGLGEPRGAAYISMIEPHRGYQQMRIREQDTHRSIPRYHGIWVMPLELTTNTLVTLQSYR